MEFSNVNKRVVFLVDHKHRDLPGLAHIGHYLRFLGHDVKYVALWEEDDIIKAFDPEFIVMNKPVSNINKSIGWKKDGRKIVIVNTEGNTRLSVDYKILVAPDLYFFWNKRTFEQYRTQLEGRGTEMCIAGSFRIDFFHKRFQEVFPKRKEMLNSLGLSDLKTVTIGTSSVYDTIPEDDLLLMDKNQKKLVNKRTSCFDVASNNREVRNIIKSFISQGIQQFRGVNIVLKPHPNEDIRPWAEFLDKLECANVKLMLGGPINHLLAISDLHITNNACTTIFEAALSGVPTVEILGYKADEFLESKGLGKYMVSDSESLIEVVRQEIYGENTGCISNSQDTLESYLKEHFYKADGFRCLEYALKIDKFMKNSTFKKHNTISFFAKHPNYILPYFPVLYHRYRPKVRGFIKEAILYDKWKVKEQDPNLIDGRGRYDNRMKPGDENIWFERFEKLGLDVEALIEEYRKKVAADEIKQK
jgi:surface carbohydrate biosynthesis protein